jgi:hypothetical protein
MTTLEFTKTGNYLKEKIEYFRTEFRESGEERYFISMNNEIDSLIALEIKANKIS